MNNMRQQADSIHSLSMLVTCTSTHSGLVWEIQLASACSQQLCRDDCQDKVSVLRKPVICTGCSELSTCMLPASCSRELSGCRVSVLQPADSSAVQGWSRRDPPLQAQRRLLRTLPIFAAAGHEQPAFTALPEGACLAPAGCEAELLQQIPATGSPAVVVQVSA